MLLHTWAPGVLRAAGLQVVETSGWTNRSHGAYPATIAGIWHHDASPPGDSPGALNWMIDNWNNASANFWVNRYGVWYCVGTGVSYQAGVVDTDMPNNFNSFGVETDQTINELPAIQLLESVRIGFAALMEAQGRSANSVHFHKSVAPKRKQDPWLGPASSNSANWADELKAERSNIQDIINGTIVPPEDFMATLSEEEKLLLLNGAKAAIHIDENLVELMNRTYVIQDHVQNRLVKNERFDPVLQDVVNRLFVIQDHIDNPENIPPKA